MSDENTIRPRQGESLEESFREVQEALDLLETYLNQRSGGDGSVQPHPIDLLVELRREVIARSTGRAGDSASCPAGL